MAGSLLQAKEGFQVDERGPRARRVGVDATQPFEFE